MGREPGNTEWAPDTDEDLVEVWPQVLQKYEEITKEKLHPGTTFAEFQVQIEQGIARSSTKSHQHTRKVLNNIGLCLEMFGGVIAQGASIVFGPASQCWNAISFVIQAGRKFAEILDGFVILMERSSVFFERLNFFLRHERGQDGSKLPHHLRKPAYNILSNFLGILASSYNLATSKKERWKTMVGVVLFNSDAGVAASLGLMEQRIQDFTNASVDQILADVKGLALYLRKSDEERARHHTEIQEHQQAIYKVAEQFLQCTQEMKSTLDGRITKDQHKDDKDKIAKSLALIKSGEAEVLSDRRHREICKAHVPTTGQWLERHDGFKKWADVNDSSTKVLFLKADSGYGKTHVSNYVVTYLQEKYKTGAGPNQAYLAYYYYSDDKDESLERCVGSLIYQFAAMDVGYATAVAKACGQPGSMGRADHQWKNLVLELSNRMKGTYFICIDGYDGRGQPDATDATIRAMVQRALSKTDSSAIAIRLFVSGNSDALSRIPQSADGISTVVLGTKLGFQTTSQVNGQVLDSSLLNTSDVEAVTRARVAELCTAKTDLKGLLDESKIKLLIEGIRGNYSHLEAKMTEINSCDTEQRVRDVISNMTEDIITVQRNNLKALDSSLNSNQIRKLNELLMWVASMGGASVKFLQSALYYTFREKYLLESEIANTYSTLLRVNEWGQVVFKSDELIKILTEGNTHEADSADRDPQDEELSKAEIDLCRRFIKNACDSVDYTRFKFDDFFDAMARKAHLHLGDDNAVNFAVFSSCVNVLCEDGEDENLIELREYASAWWYEYLRTLVEKLDTFEPKRQSLSDIGVKLVDMFYEPEKIDAWFLKENLGILKHDWLQRDELLEILQKFLKIPHVAKGYAKDAKKNEWVRKAFSETVNKYLLLERIARRLAQGFFSSTKIAPPDFLWIPYGIVVKRAGESFDQSKTPSSNEVDRFFEWVRLQEFPIEDHVRAYCIGAANLQFKRYEEALRGFEEAEKHPSSSWGVVLGLIRAHENLKNYREALKFISKFKDFSNHSLETDEDFKEPYFTVLLAEGNCYRECQEYEAAAKCFEDILVQDTCGKGLLAGVHTQALLGLFTTWVAGKRYEPMVNFLRSWKQAQDPDRGPAYWLQKTLYSDKIHGYIILAAKHADAVEDLCALYQEAIDYLALKTHADAEQYYPSTRGQLQYFQAALRYHGSPHQHDHDRGLRSWEELIRKDDEYWWSAYDAARRLSSSLLDKALAGSSPEVYESYFSKLSILAKMNNTVIRNSRQGQKDPRLCLIRLQHVKGNHEAALTEAQDRFCSVFDYWPKDENDNGLPIRFANLAQTLTVLDRDSDAIVAWQAVMPKQQRKLQNPDTEAEQTLDADSQVAQSEPTSAAAIDEAQEPTVTVKGTPEAYISGYHCDAECETVWTHMLEDCYVCKYCLCVQLCPGCYKKLQDNELSPIICNKNHKMLYLPPFDQEKWQTMSPDMVIVDGQPVPRSQWLNKIRDEYGMQQEQLDMIKLQKARVLKAASRIAVHILRLQKRYKKKRAEQPAAPMLRRAQTAIV